MSQENVKWGRRFVGGVVCVGVLLALVTPAMAAFPGRNGRIAYADPDHGMFSVWPNGAGRHRLVRHGVGPAYSPRGDRIVFWRFFEFRFPGGGFTELGRLELIAANGRRHRVLTGGDDYHPAWAPDGKRIVFARDNPAIGTTTRKAIVRPAFSGTRSTAYLSVDRAAVRASLRMPLPGNPCGRPTAGRSPTSAARSAVS
jgi:hypothetical protein